MAIEKIDKTHAKLIVSRNIGGKRKRHTKIVTYTGKKDLERQYREFEAEVLSNKRTDITVLDLVESYITNRKMLGVRETTIHGYEIAKNRIEERFDGILAHELTKLIRLMILSCLWA